MVIKGEVAGGDGDIKINKKRLRRELSILGLIALGVFLLRFLPWLMEQPIPRGDPYAGYYSLLHEAERYDYSAGQSSTLERKLDRATTSAGSDPTKYYFNLKAKGLYYLNLGTYDVAIATLGRALSFAPLREEKFDIYDMLVQAYSALGQEDKAKEYQELLDEK